MTTFMSAFSGGGLADIGLIAAGLEHVGGIEYDPAICGVYQRNVGPVRCGPIEEASAMPYKGVDLMWFSPVCKSFSAAKVGGVELESDIASARNVDRFIHFARPKYVVIENVSAYRHSKSFRVICDRLTEDGYGYEYGIVNSADVGVPQTRRRLILRAVRGSRVPPLVQTHSEGGRGGLLPWNGWYAAVEDLMPTLPESQFALWQVERLPKKLTETVMTDSGANGSRMTTVLSKADPMFTLMAGSNRANYPRAFVVDGRNTRTSAREPWTLREGDDPYFTVTSADGVERNRAFVSGEPSPSLLPPGTGRINGLEWLDYGRVVSMTTRALARFQSVPDTYELPANVALASMIVGNGVPCLLAQRIAESLMNAECDKGYAMPKQFCMGFAI